MSAIGSEFLIFLKKLEDNGDKVVTGTPSEQPNDFDFNASIINKQNMYLPFPLRC